MVKKTTRNHSYGLTLIILAVFIVTVPASADYTISLTSGGLSEIDVEPGDTFDLDLGLTSDDSDMHDSAIFQVIFSESGFSYKSYTWTTPYLNSTDDDDSAPIIGDLPVTLDADTLSGIGYPADVVDIELSNTADGDFGIGILATLTLQVPEDWSPVPDVVLIGVVPDTFANGFAEITTNAGQDFTVNIIPEPTTLSLLVLGGLAMMRKKQRK